MLLLRGLLRTLAVVAAVLTTISAQARTSVSNLDFDSATAGLYVNGDTLFDQGFKLKVLGDFAAVDTAASCFIATCPSGNDTQFYQSFNDSRVELSRTDGRLFQLLGLDAGFIAPLPLAPGLDAGGLHLHGVTADGSLIDRTFAFGLSGQDGGFAFSHYGTTAQPLADMGLLRSVELFACTWDADDSCANPNQNLGQFALDNVTLQPVPEPATATLLALGLAGLLRSRKYPRPVA